MIPLWAYGAASKAWGFLKSNPLLALCAILAVWGLAERHSAHKWQDRAEQCRQASVAARKAQEALREQERKDYQEKADHADQEYRAGLADARAATDAFIRSRRVQPSRVSPAQPVGKADPAGVRQDVPADSFVAVSEPDVQACSDATAYAVALREWAISVTQP